MIKVGINQKNPTLTAFHIIPSRFMKYKLIELQDDIDKSTLNFNAACNNGSQ